MNPRIFGIALLLAAGVTHAGTPTQYQETYDADGNRTWTKYLREPIPGQIPSGTVYSGSSLTGAETTTDSAPYSTLSGYDFESAIRTEQLDNRSPDNK